MSIPSSLTPLFSTGAGGAAGYQIERSLRFNSSDSAYLSRTPAVAGNRKTFTLSFWWKNTVKSLGLPRLIFTGQAASPQKDYFTILSTNDVNSLSFSSRSGGDDIFSLITTPVFRDPSAWYHIVLQADTTQATASNRLRLYVNGTQVTAFSTATYPSQNLDIAYINESGASHFLGRYLDNAYYYLDSYLADVHFIDGQQLTPSSFTEVSATTGQLIPKTYSGSYGTNGFQLKFADNSAATATTLGKDTSGNGNNWTPNNLSVTAGAGNDSLVDTPTSFGTDTGVGGEVRGNYATFNPLANKLQNVGTTVTLSNGNLDIVGAASNSSSCAGTFGVSSGKWYFEYTVVAQAETNDTFGFGIRRDLFTGTYDNWEPYFRGTRLRGSDNGFYVAESGGDFSTPTSNGTVVGIAFDIDTNYCAVYVNGTIRKSSSSAGLSGYTWFPYVAGDGGGAVTVNFGQRPFAYQTPGTNRPAATFLALCDTNLPAPLVAKPNQHFDAITYTGNGSTLTIPNVNSTPTSIAFDPGFIWFKQRASPKRDHNVYDVIRGTTKLLSTNGTSGDASTYDVYPGDGAEQTVSGLTAFNTGSKTVDVGSSNVANGSSSSYVAWAWYAGATTDPSNQAGSITSQVRANVSAGFSVATFTGATTGTVGHGLGVAPSMIIMKARTSNPGANDWFVYHKSVGNTAALLLNSAAATNTYTYWNNTSPTSTVFSIGSGIGTPDWVAYCFAPVVGYSSFGSASLNASADGAFIYLGFRPKFFMLKGSDNTSNWIMLDSQRDPFNFVDQELFANLSNAEGTPGSTYSFDFLSNGVKARNQGLTGSFIYMAFAESPLQYARAR